MINTDLEMLICIAYMSIDYMFYLVKVQGMFDKT